MPNALAIGVPYDLFWHLTPTKLKAFQEARKIKREMLDEEMWVMGQYVLSAVGVAVERCLAGKDSRAKYIEKPILLGAREEEMLSEEEKYERDLQKALLAEEMWIISGKQKGLKETII